MSVARIMSRSRDSSDPGSPAPRIRVGYKRQSDIPEGMNHHQHQQHQQQHTYNQGTPSSNRESMYRPSSTYSNSSRDLLQQQQHQHQSTHSYQQHSQQHSQQQQLHQSSPRRLAHSPTPPPLPPLLEMDHHVLILTELLADTVLLPRDALVDSSPFLSANRLELYDQDPGVCAQILRDERKIVLERRRGVEVEQMKQDTAQALLKVEEVKMQGLDLAAETMSIAPESLAPLSQSRTKLLDDLGNILSKIRGLLETVHIQFEEELEVREHQRQQFEREQAYEREEQQKQQEGREGQGREEYGKEESNIENGGGRRDTGDTVLASIERLCILQQTQQHKQQEQQQQLQRERGLLQSEQRTKTPVPMDIFQMHGLMDLYDREPEKCIELLRVEHARLATRRDDLELEYERQRTALLKTMQR
ncbi:MAG: hypothetical protein J3R72DRAFT_61137 [Linnemannia gamsii]|nr:MAG: hypothetical protein J3R72DRAFT_61137 [Linnemannia gamsii]